MIKVRLYILLKHNLFKKTKLILRDTSHHQIIYIICQIIRSSDYQVIYISRILFRVCHAKRFQNTISLLSWRQSTPNLFWVLNPLDLKHEKLLIRYLLNTEICYIKIHGPRPAPSTFKDNTQFNFLLGQIFSLKQKHWILTTRSSRHGITMGKCTTNVIQADLGIFTYIPAYSGIIQAYEVPRVTVVYPELSHI